MRETFRLHGSYAMTRGSVGAVHRACNGPAARLLYRSAAPGTHSGGSGSGSGVGHAQLEQELPALGLTSRQRFALLGLRLV